MSAERSTNGGAQHVPLDELTTYLGELVAAFEVHPDAQTREAALGLVQGMDALHRAAFTRLTAFLNERQAGHLLLEAAENDRLIATVLALYDLVPPEVAVRQAEAALDRVRPYVESHGGVLQVLEVNEGVVYLAMGGACHGCAGAAYTLQRGVRQALADGFPGFVDVVVAEAPATSGATSASGFIALDAVYTPPSLLQAPDFRPVATVADIAAGMVMPVEVDGIQLLLVHASDEFYAVGALCPGSMLPLSNGRLEGTSLICGWHGERFDLHTGACLDRGDTRQSDRLAVYPVAVQEGAVLVAVNVPARAPVLESSAQ